MNDKNEVDATGEDEAVEIVPLKLFETTYHFDRAATDMTFVPELEDVEDDELEEEESPDPKDSSAPESVISQYYEAMKTRTTQELQAADVPVDEGDPEEFESGTQTSSSTEKPSSGKKKQPA